MQQTTAKGETTLHARTTLVFYHRNGAQAVQLDKGHTVVLGRSEPADVVIADPGLSRQHARFTWDDAGIWVEDLKSTNGTKKNGEPVTKATIVPGDEIAVGPVRVSVHIISSLDPELRGFDGHDRFVAALDDELTRARTFGRPLGLMMVSGGKHGHVSKWAVHLRARLRPVDRVGIYGPTTVLVSIPEATPRLLDAIAVELRNGALPLSVGAVMYPSDGGSVEELIAAVKLAMRANQLPSGTLESQPPAEATAMVVKNPAMKQLMTTVKRVAQSTIAVLIHGETGTGKEVIARAIHDSGPRRKQPLRCINCAAIPETLIESVLFGHVQGAYTGADKTARGIFEQADGGTVLLDEIGELAAGAQAALLRVLETKKVMRVGGDREIDVDVRVIAATHRDLDAMVDAGRFRQDLLYRLNTMIVRIPPLRERVDEIRPLAERFLKDARAAASEGNAREIDPQALAALEAYAWPGNVRELRNAIERAVVLAEGKAITLVDLTDRIRGGARTHAKTGVPDAPTDYRQHVRDYETELILKALANANGNQTEAARALNLPLRTLVHKIQTYNIKKKFDR
jgi:DNA-binding NtrC family response regulator